MPPFSNPIDEENMSAHTMRGLRAACTLGLIALSCAATAQDTGAGVRYGAAPALDCKAISKTAAPGNWVETSSVATAFSSTQSGSAPSSATAQVRLSFSNPVTTDMVHASMNAAGARGLALVEVQDTKGDWHKAWEGKMAPPAPGFEQTCFEQKLAQKQAVQALRFSFNPGPGQVEVNHAALLRR
jgi:hypothetical protein